MAMNMDQLKNMLNSLGLKYYLDPQRDAAMLGGAGYFGQYQCIILLELDGTFLQMRSINYAHCPAGNPQLLPVLKVLGSINYIARLAKVGWDSSDGEIIFYADAWPQDAAVTEQQFARMIQTFFTVMDTSYPRLLATLETGKDPGDINPENISEVLQREGSSLPPSIKALLEKLRSEQGAGSDLSHI